ncbi:MAG: rhodanese-like domain-containing protein [Chloroflexota bacterium]|nr:rhodanese-like domain-containing protein [Chloroflexota bacterium]
MALALHNNGRTNVRILKGGLDAWKSAGGPVIP